VLGYLGAIVLPPLLRLAPHWGAAGLTASAGVAGWIEFLMLRASLNRRVGTKGLEKAYAARIWAAAIVAGAVAFAVRRALPSLHPILTGGVVLSVYGALYLGGAALIGIPLPGLRRTG
jgi:putative peptidoglycan lipid II flippase